MREILFRGKRIKDEEWIEGSLLALDADNGYYFITEPYKSTSTLPVRDLIYNHTCLVDPKTVCQYIGLTDRNGKKIFEGDILYGEFYGYPFPCNETFKIYWDESEKGFEANYFNENNCEVIGNIFDNPELLKGGIG